MPNALSIMPVAGLPEIEPGHDLAASITAHIDLDDGDIVLITSKVVSKAEGRIVELDDVQPSEFVRLRLSQPAPSGSFRPVHRSHAAAPK